MKEIEIQYLRDEMMMIFDRIKFALVFWIGSYTGVMAYYLKTPNSIAKPYVLSGLLIIIFVGSTYILRKQNNIYKIGTYIAIEHEETNSIRWHRVNRQFDNYLKLEKIDWKMKILKLSISWGSDTFFYGMITAIITILSTFVIMNNCNSYNPFRLFEGYDFAWIGNTILLVLYISIIINVVTFFVMPGIYKDNMKSYWTSYLNDFGDSFEDQYK